LCLGFLPERSILSSSVHVASPLLHVLASAVRIARNSFSDTTTTSKCGTRVSECQEEQITNAHFAIAGYFLMRCGFLSISNPKAIEVVLRLSVL